MSQLLLPLRYQRGLHIVGLNATSSSHLSLQLYVYSGLLFQQVKLKQSIESYFRSRLNSLHEKPCHVYRDKQSFNVLYPL